MSKRNLAVTLTLAVLLVAGSTGLTAGADRGREADAPDPNAALTPPILAIHGGCGTIVPEGLTAETEAEYRKTIAAALQVGHQILRDGGSAVDAVEATVRLMEDSPRFNAGKGAVFNADGINELDASIMDGATENAGAVAAATRVKNPISAARAVMDRTDHVLLAGEGADRFATEAGLEMVDPEYYYTERRWQSLLKARERQKEKETEEHGTVGAVAIDLSGHMAAATSTGGRTNKLPGRVGDSPIIGAGTFADATCAVSGTGHGEFFIRQSVAFQICSLVRNTGLSASRAAEIVVHDRLSPLDVDAGVIVLTARGEVSLAFNTSGMPRGYISADGIPHVQLFNTE